MRYSLIVLAVALATAPGCQRRQAPQAGQTEITAIEIERPAPATRTDHAALQEFRDNARADLMNLDRRILYLEIRANSTSAPKQARIELAQARQKRDALALTIDELAAGTWQTKRDALDRDWEDASNLTDSVASLLTDNAR
jgi:hypothetical protein